MSGGFDPSRSLLEGAIHITAEQRRNARLYVAEKAVDADEAALFLAMLGLGVEAA